MSEQPSIGLYQKYRPKRLKEFVGQPIAVSIIQTWLDREVPHVILFRGPVGCGKTSLARFLKTKLECSDSDYYELNIADVRGIDTIRDIRAKMSLSPMGGSCRIWVLDEIASATRESMEALLKILEDTPSHVYFFLCTMSPERLPQAIITRCKHVELNTVGEEDLVDLCVSIAQKEGVTLPDSVALQIAQNSSGSPRMALGILEGVLWLADEEEQLEAISKSSIKTQGESLAKLLMNEKCTWPEVAKFLKETNEQPESLRIQVLGYANVILLGKRGNSQQRAYRVISAMRFNFYDSKQAGLSAACWEIVNS